MHQDRFLQYLPSEIRDDVKQKWRGCGGDGSAMWEVWQQKYDEWKQLKAYEARNKKFSTADKDLGLEALVLCYLYPRLDAHVSTSTNHLLKSPFCVHPKTGNICVPFDPNNVENFKLAEVPNLTTAINELGKMPRDQSSINSAAVDSSCSTPLAGTCCAKTLLLLCYLTT